MFIVIGVFLNEMFLHVLEKLNKIRENQNLNRFRNRSTDFLQESYLKKTLLNVHAFCHIIITHQKHHIQFKSISKMQKINAFNPNQIEQLKQVEN